MIKRIRSFLRGWLGVCDIESESSKFQRKIELEIACQNGFIRQQMSEIKEYTRVDADIAPMSRGGSCVIVTGVYRNQGFVSFYDMSDKEFSEVVDFIRRKERHSLVRNVDTLPGFRKTFNFD